jgi:hypothetical protein
MYLLISSGPTPFPITEAIEVLYAREGSVCLLCISSELVTGRRMSLLSFNCEADTWSNFPVSWFSTMIWPVWVIAISLRPLPALASSTAFTRASLFYFILTTSATCLFNNCWACFGLNEFWVILFNYSTNTSTSFDNPFAITASSRSLAKIPFSSSSPFLPPECFSYLGSS